MPVNANASTPIQRDGAPAPPADVDLLYDTLRRLAASYLRRERVNHTLQPTALVHEAFLKLADDQTREDPSTFMMSAARAMRQVLIDHARGRRRLKRGGGAARSAFDDAEHAVEANGVDVLALDEALTRLASLSRRQAQVVELRFFGGLTAAEAAAALGVSLRTVEGDWAVAKAFLRRELGDG